MLTEKQFSKIFNLNFSLHFGHSYFIKSSANKCLDKIFNSPFKHFL